MCVWLRMVRESCSFAFPLTCASQSCTAASVSAPVVDVGERRESAERRLSISRSWTSDEAGTPLRFSFIEVRAASASFAGTFEAAEPIVPMFR